MVPLKVTISPSSIYFAASFRPATNDYGRGGITLIRSENVFRIEIKVAPRLNGVIGEEVLLIDIDPPKPVAVRDLLHPADLPNLFFVGEGKWENEGDRIPGNQAVCCRCFGARIPGTDKSTEQSEGQDGNRNT
jgi:hypothetical protein